MLNDVVAAYDSINRPNIIKIQLINQGVPELVQGISTNRNVPNVFISELLDSDEIKGLRELHSADVILVFVGAPLRFGNTCGQASLSNIISH